MDFINFEVSGQMLLVTLGALFALIIAITLLVKLNFSKSSEKLISQQENNQKFINRNKYAKLNVFGLSGTFFNVGLVFSISFAILAFNWTQYEPIIDTPIELDHLEPDLLIVPPPTFPKPPPPPPPPPPKIVEVPTEDLPEESVEFKSNHIEVDNIVIPYEPETKKIVPPPPPRPKEKVGNDLPMVFAETMPMFKGCDQTASKEERKKCGDQKMLEFIYKNIHYPAIARENGIEGTVVIRFIIERDGSISNAKIVREIGGGCGTEAMRIVEKMPNWHPGKQNGRPVRVIFNLPIKYSLN